MTPSAPVLDQLLVGHDPADASGDPSDEPTRRHILRDDRAGRNESFFANLDSGRQQHASSDAAGPPERRGLKRFARGEARHRVVVHRDHARTHEYVIVDALRP